MISKTNLYRKRSSMSFNRLYLLCIHQRFRNLFSLKLILLIIIFLFFILYYLFSQQNFILCNPEQSLWWFCSWPDPKTSVCSWEQHFPLISKEKTRSPESYAELLLSRPKIRPSFEFNNKTFLQCNENEIDLLIIIISKCSHSSIRQTIRRTWGNTDLLKEYFPNLKIKLLFLVDIDSKSEKKIELEYIYHKDIIQVINLPEQYEYVTERESSIYKFINNYCKQTKYIFKTDDDIFINTFLLLFFLNKNLNELEKTKYILYGFPIKYGLVIRHTDNYVGQRYIITKNEYSCSRYPTFLSGFGYLMSFHTLNLFLNAYLTDIKPFPLSDVYFTGLLSELFNLERKSFFENINYRYETKCSKDFFKLSNNALACAASDNHFNKKQSNENTNFMNDYNLYWTQLINIYQSLKNK